MKLGLEPRVGTSFHPVLFVNLESPISAVGLCLPWVRSGRVGRTCFSWWPMFPSRWPTSTNEKPETDNWDAWAAQPSLTVPSAGQLRQRSAFTPATATGSSPSPVLGQVRAVGGSVKSWPAGPSTSTFGQCIWTVLFLRIRVRWQCEFGSCFLNSVKGVWRVPKRGNLLHRLILFGRGAGWPISRRIL